MLEKGRIKVGGVDKLEILKKRSLESRRDQRWRGRMKIVLKDITVCLLPLLRAVEPVYTVILAGSRAGLRQQDFIRTFLVY